MSHPYKVHNALGDPLRLTHYEILEKVHDWEDHVVDVLPRYRRIMETRQADIDRELFSNDSEARDVVDAMMEEALLYMRQCRNTRSRGRVCHTQ